MPPIERVPKTSMALAVGPDPKLILRLGIVGEAVDLDTLNWFAVPRVMVGEAS